MIRWQLKKLRKNCSQTFMEPRSNHQPKFTYLRYAWLIFPLALMMLSISEINETSKMTILFGAEASPNCFAYQSASHYIARELVYSSILLMACVLIVLILRRSIGLSENSIPIFGLGFPLLTLLGRLAEGCTF